MINMNNLIYLDYNLKEGANFSEAFNPPPSPNINTTKIQVIEEKNVIIFIPNSSRVIFTFFYDA